VDLPSLVEVIVALLALGAALFLVYGAWLAMTCTMSRRAERAPERATHRGDEVPDH
jgi:hypothetical protein